MRLVCVYLNGRRKWQIVNKSVKEVEIGRLLLKREEHETLLKRVTLI